MSCYTTVIRITCRPIVSLFLFICLVIYFSFFLSFFHFFFIFCGGEGQSCRSKIPVLVASPSANDIRFQLLWESLLETVIPKASRQSVLNWLKVEIVYTFLNHLLLHLYNLLVSLRLPGQMLKTLPVKVQRHYKESWRWTRNRKLTMAGKK